MPASRSAVPATNAFAAACGSRLTTFTSFTDKPFFFSIHASVKYGAVPGALAATVLPLRSVIFAIFGFTIIPSAPKLLSSWKICVVATPFAFHTIHVSTVVAAHWMSPEAMARWRSFCGIFLMSTSRPCFLKMPASFASVSGANPVQPEMPTATLVCACAANGSSSSRDRARTVRFMRNSSFDEKNGLGRDPERGKPVQTAKYARERAVADEPGGARDVGGEIAVPEHRRAMRAQQRVSRLDRRRAAHRPQELDALRGRQQLDAEDVRRVLDHRQQPARGERRHRHMVLLVRGRRQRIDACRVSQRLVLGGERGGGHVRDHESAVEPRLGRQERRQA